jgi:hypothetical protein
MYRIYPMTAEGTTCRLGDSIKKEVTFEVASSKSPSPPNPDTMKILWNSPKQEEEGPHLGTILPSEAKVSENDNREIFISSWSD